MTVSVIIPCYNQAHFLGETIESALKQSEQPFEVIVIDDGSTDHTREVTQSFPGIRYIRQDNKGLCEARNAGFNASTGEYLVFLDSDDRLAPRMIETGLATLESAPDAAFVYGKMRRISVEGVSIGERAEPVRTNYYRDFLTDNYIPTPGMVLFRRSCLLRHGLFDPRFPATADYDIYLRITRKDGIAFHPGVAVERRVHPEAMTCNASNMLVSVLKIHQQQWNYAKSDKLLREAYHKGRKFWRSWYGNQLAIQLRVNRMLGRRKEFLSEFPVLLRYAPAHSMTALRPAQHSNTLEFQIQENIESGSPVYKIAVMNSGNTKQDIGLLIKDISVERNCASGTVGAAMGNRLVVSLDCVGAQIGMKLYIDEKLIPAIVANSKLVIAYAQPAELSTGSLHTVQLAG